MENLVVPFAVKLVAFHQHIGRLRVCDFSFIGIICAVRTGVHFKTRLRAGHGNQVDDDLQYFMTDADTNQPFVIVEIVDATGNRLAQLLAGKVVCVDLPGGCGPDPSEVRLLWFFRQRSSAAAVLWSVSACS